VASRLNPYINVLDGRAREALEFYQSVLGGALNVMTFGDMGTEGPFATQVMHGQLETSDGYTLMVADAPAEMMAVTVGTNISISLSGGTEDAETLRAHFAGLADGGQVAQPLEPAPWGDEFGMLVDKFGVSWLVNIAGAGNQG
jgi:PhnB protein